jgi:hypothetical protein
MNIILKHSVLLFLTFSIAFIVVQETCASPPEDQFIRGYAAAVLEREFKVQPLSLHVEEGVISLRVREVSEEKQEEIRTTLSGIQGVTRVEIFDAGRERESLPSSFSAQERDVREKEIFEPLIADPRWPHFSLSYQYYIDDDELQSVGATSFGATIPLLSGKAPYKGSWEFGIQAAVHAIFDLDSQSMDLVNADYWVGFPLSYRRGDFSGIFRVYHQSSHLGDEFILRSRIDRVNLSYESTDMKLSYEMLEWLRVYTGGGLLIRKEPEDIKPWSAQFGLEMKSPATYFNGRLRPVFGADFQSKEENSWNTDVTLRGGVELTIRRIHMVGHRMQFMLEYFNGHSPHGQFYERQIQYISLGTHFYF